MKQVTQIPYKNPITQKLEGRVIEYNTRIAVGNILLPELLSKKLLRRCQNYDHLQDAIDDKEIYVRGRIIDNQTQWFGLVSAEFKSMDPEFLDTHMQNKARDRIIRYDPGLERVQIGYLINTQGTDRVMLHLDSGNFGVYGGNGESAVKVGISITQDDPNMWTLFYNNQAQQKYKSAVHKSQDKSVGIVLKEQFSYATHVQEQWHRVATRSYTPTQLTQLANDYLDRQKNIVLQTISQFPQGTNGRDFVATLQHNTKDLLGHAQIDLEERLGKFIQHVN